MCIRDSRGTRHCRLAIFSPHPKIPPMNAPSSPQTPWTNVRHGWQQLYGSFEKMGISIEWHDFKTSKPLDWAESFRPGSIEFCLNLDGRGAVGRGSGTPEDYGPSSSGYYAIGQEPLRATRQAHDHHRFVTLEYSCLLYTSPSPRD